MFTGRIVFRTCGDRTPPLRTCGDRRGILSRTNSTLSAGESLIFVQNAPFLSAFRVRLSSLVGLFFVPVVIERIFFRTYGDRKQLVLQRTCGDRTPFVRTCGDRTPSPFVPVVIEGVFFRTCGDRRLITSGLCFR